jgi:hypothetical protein
MCKAEKQAVFPTHSAFEIGKTHPQKCQNIAFSALMLRIYSISGQKHNINVLKRRFSRKNAKRKAPPAQARMCWTSPFQTSRKGVNHGNFNHSLS